MTRSPVYDPIATRPRDWREHQADLADFASATVPYPLLFATISGADLYGFPSADGDYDIRATHVLPLRKMIVAPLHGASWYRMSGATVEKSQEHIALLIDLVSHDIGKALHLALKGNGYVLEQILSPLVLVTTAWHEELREIAQGCITRRVYYHYRGFFTGQQKLYNKAGDKRVKGLLYQYRVAMTGIVALETGEIEANVLRLNERFHLPGVEELVARKVSGERTCVENDAPYLREIASLEPRLDEAYERSALPDRTPSEVWAAAEDFLFRCRLAVRQVGNLSYTEGMGKE
ncbi:MAG: nucleotidyltransferase [Chloroflexi bacterium]|nr:MAG: nucleotidyltransferase [Chloroflexota bacterium]RLC83957.1 MAG: nucleotidyltransferase [Chloroflexota bacterium]